MRTGADDAERFAPPGLPGARRVRSVGDGGEADRARGGRPAGPTPCTTKAASVLLTRRHGWKSAISRMAPQRGLRDRGTAPATVSVASQTPALAAERAGCCRWS